MTEYFDEHMLIEQPNETPEQLLARYQQQARAWRWRATHEANPAAAGVVGDFAYMLEQLTGALADALASTTEPLRIEDMAPGTTFTACLHQVYSDNRPFRYMTTQLSQGKRFVGTDGTFWSADQFDPSTIHDVTPPVATS